MELQEQKMNELPFEETCIELKRGDVVKGKVVQIEPAAVLVDIGGKTEGTIPLEELSHNPVQNPRTVVRIGDEFEVFVLKTEDENGVIQVSKKRADLERTWRRIQAAKKSGETLQATVVEHVKGGLVVDLGVRGFIPASHMGKHFVRNLDEYLGETLSLKVLELDIHRGRVVLSHRQAAEEEGKKNKHLFWKDIYVGQLRKGKVARFAPFGAFIELGGVDGLIHLSELSWKRVKNPKEVVRIGEQVEVMVLGVDAAKERISLSLRRAQPDPWTQLPPEAQPGAVLPGTVSKVAPRYTFVEVYPGVEGLVPQMDLNRENKKLTEGDRCRVRIVEMKPDERRMLLSVKVEETAVSTEPDDIRNYLAAQEDRPLTLKDLLGDQLSGHSLP